MTSLAATSISAAPSRALEHIDVTGWLLAGGDEEQAGHAAPVEIGAPVGVLGPVQAHDVHPVGRKPPVREAGKRPLRQWSEPRHIHEVEQ